VVADALSRRPDFALILDHFCLALANLSTPVSDTLADLVKGQEADAFCSKLMSELRTSHDPVLHSRFALTPSGSLVWTAKGLERLVVPPPFRAALLKQAHDSPSSGHRGVDKTYHALSEAYYWPAMFRDVHA
jgi:hypothetical protein